MKKYFLILILIFLNCQLFAQDHSYKFRWVLNPERDMHSYQGNVYLMPDSNLTFPSIHISDTLNFSHAGLDSIYNAGDTVLVLFTSQENGDFLAFRLMAVDSSGNRSGYGFSNLLRKDDRTAPSVPAGLRVQY